MKWREDNILFLFILLAVVIRIPAFFPYCIDHDESTYLLIAQQLLDGKIPYVDNLDVKPLGIYLLFAAVFKIFGVSIAIVRVFAAVFIALSAYFIYGLSKTIFEAPQGGKFAGFLYIIAASLHKWGWSGNTELFFVTLGLASFYVLLHSKHLGHYLIAGILAGIGFIVKYHILFDVSVFLGYYMFFSGKRFQQQIPVYTLYLLGFILPFGLCHLVYWQIGHFDEFVFATYTIPGRYSTSASFSKILSFISEFYLSYLPITLLLIWLNARLWKRKMLAAKEKTLLLAWTIFAWIAILITGKLFFHYYYQVLPVFAISSATIFRMPLPRWMSKLIQSPVLFLFLIGGLWFNQWMQLYPNRDYLAEISAEVNLRGLDPGQTIYTNYKNILYFLCDAEIPTKYIHTTVLYREDLVNAYGVNRQKEFENIFVDHRPQYCILKGNPDPLITSYLDKSYRIIKTFPGEINLWVYQ